MWSVQRHSLFLLRQFKSPQVRGCKLSFVKVNPFFSFFAYTCEVQLLSNAVRPKSLFVPAATIQRPTGENTVISKSTAIQWLWIGLPIFNSILFFLPVQLLSNAVRSTSLSIPAEAIQKPTGEKLIFRIYCKLSFVKVNYFIFLYIFFAYTGEVHLLSNVVRPKSLFVPAATIQRPTGENTVMSKSTVMRWLWLVLPVFNSILFFSPVQVKFSCPAMRFVQSLCPFLLL